MSFRGEVNYDNHDYEYDHVNPSKSPPRQLNGPVEFNRRILVPEKNEVLFSNKSENYCICFIDIVGSTQITAKITPSDTIVKFYSNFINAVASIVKVHN